MYGWNRSGLARRLVVANNFLDNEIEKLLGEIRIEFGAMRQHAQTRDLSGLTVGIRGRQAFDGFQLSHRLGAFEAFGQKMNERRVDIIDAVAQGLQLWNGHNHGESPISAC